MTSIFGFEEAYAQSMFRIKENSDNFWKKSSTDSCEISRWTHLTHTLGGTAAILPAAFLATTENVIKLPLILTTTVLLEIPLATLGHSFNVVRCPSLGGFFLGAQKDVPGMRAFMLCAFKIVRLSIGMLFTATVGLCISTQINHWVHIKLQLIKPVPPPQPKKPIVETQNNHTELEEALKRALDEKRNSNDNREELLQLSQKQTSYIYELEVKIAKVLQESHQLHHELYAVKEHNLETEMKLQEMGLKLQEREKLEKILLPIAAFIERSRAQKESLIDCSAINQRIDERADEIKSIEQSLEEMDDFEGQ
jgi:hypothetical protein